MTKILVAALALLATGALAENAAQAATSPAAAVAITATAVPAVVLTPTPLYVNYQAPDWAKAKEHETWDEAKRLSKQKGVLFVDARGKAEYDQGHIPGAIPLPSYDFEKYYQMHKERINKAKKLIAYCHGIGCRLSEKTANALVEKGHKNVGVFFGGWPQWQEHKMPVETGDPYAPPVPTPAPTAVPTIAPTAAPVVAPATTSPAAK